MNILKIGSTLNDPQVGKRFAPLQFKSTEGKVTGFHNRRGGTGPEVVVLFELVKGTERVLYTLPEAEKLLGV